MARKPKTPQKENLTAVDGRDLFQTPNYAVDILVPYLENIQPPITRGFNEWETTPSFVIWEPAAGLGKIVNRLRFHGFDVFGSDLSEGTNFLTDPPPADFDCSVTNPPFSLKKKFYEQCLGYGKPFALLVPCDYSAWIIKAIDVDGCEKIIPRRRIDYITPDALVRIHEGEIWETVKYTTGILTLNEFKEDESKDWEMYLEKYKDFCKWDSIYDVPAAFLKKYSSSQFHSMWLTRGFNLGRTETFVDLSQKDKLNI